jgi:hypothetical protein
VPRCATTPGSVAHGDVPAWPGRVYVLSWVGGIVYPVCPPTVNRRSRTMFPGGQGLISADVSIRQMSCSPILPGGTFLLGALGWSPRQS